MEQMILLNQAKEKMEKTEDELQAAKEDNQRMADKINKRNEQIAQLSRGGNISDVSIDPDLQMVRDEHNRQIKQLGKEAEDERKKRKAMEAERDEWQIMVESLKADVERAKQDAEKSKMEVSLFSSI